MQPVVLVALACAILAGCDGERRTANGGTPRTGRSGDVGTSTPTDGGAARDLDATGDLDATPDLDAGSAPPLDASALDASAPDDARALGDDARVAANPDAAAPPDSGPPSATVQLTTTCGADFGGDPVVSYNGSIAVGSLRGAALTASVQFDFRGQTGVIALGTRHRIDTGLVVNLVTQSTWTNLSQDARVITGMAPDTIGGTLNLRSYDGPRGVMDVELTDVRLQNPSDLSFCTINGRVRAQRLGR